jgi:phosphopantothenoylcysteine decarboxylase/phosphopantothenate--cysteine ligase
VQRGDHKIKKDAEELTLQLTKNPDILAELGVQKGDRVLVGFAAETERLLAHAAEKLQKKNLDMIVANDVSVDGAGFEVDTNIVRFLFRDGRVKELDLMSKEQVASHLLNQVIALWRSKQR